MAYSFCRPIHGGEVEIAEIKSTINLTSSTVGLILTLCEFFFVEPKIIPAKYMGVSKNMDTPNWMVKIMENPIKIDDLGVPLFSETPI